MIIGGVFAEPALGEVRVLTASAEGLPLQQVVVRSLSTVAHALGADPHLVDVVPLPDDDRAGISSFALELGLLVPAVSERSVSS